MVWAANPLDDTRTSVDKSARLEARAQKSKLL